MMSTAMRDSQLAMAHYLRNPDTAPPPAGIEQRRLDIYQRLVYNNIEGFISGGFPVVRSLYAEDDWHRLVRSFIDGHRCHTPYFLEISQEFIHFLLHDYRPRESDPPFLAELAHYEWVELALDVAEAAPPGPWPAVDVMTAVPRLSPLAWLLAYQYPVHRIGPASRPAGAEQPSYLVVYRNREERVRFIEVNTLTARLLELTRDNNAATGRELLETLARETGSDVSLLLESGARQLAEFFECSVLGLASDSAFGDRTLVP